VDARGKASSLGGDNGRPRVRSATTVRGLIG